jgi:hypothetical protein
LSTSLASSRRPTWASTLSLRNVLPNVSVIDLTSRVRLFYIIEQTGIVKQKKDGSTEIARRKESQCVSIAPALIRQAQTYNRMHSYSFPAVKLSGSLKIFGFEPCKKNPIQPMQVVFLLIFQSVLQLLHFLILLTISQKRGALNVFSHRRLPQP